MTSKALQSNFIFCFKNITFVLRCISPISPFPFVSHLSICSGSRGHSACTFGLLGSSESMRHGVRLHGVRARLSVLHLASTPCVHLTKDSYSCQAAAHPCCLSLWILGSTSSLAPSSIGMVNSPPPHTGHNLILFLKPNHLLINCSFFNFSAHSSFWIGHLLLPAMAQLMQITVSYQMSVLLYNNVSGKKTFKDFPSSLLDSRWCDHFAPMLLWGKLHGAFPCSDPLLGQSWRPLPDGRDVTRQG